MISFFASGLHKAAPAPGSKKLGLPLLELKGFADSGGLVRTRISSHQLNQQSERQSLTAIGIRDFSQCNFI